MEKNRKQRKACWISAKNLMRKYPECAYNGDFYCNHVYNKEHGWSWVDFRFFHTTLKKYFFVAMTTAEYDALKVNEERVLEELNKIHPYPEDSMIFHPIDDVTGVGRIEFTAEHTAAYNNREPIRQQRMLELNREAPVQ